MSEDDNFEWGSIDGSGSENGAAQEHSASEADVVADDQPTVPFLPTRSRYVQGWEESDSEREDSPIGTHAWGSWRTQRRSTRFASARERPSPGLQLSVYWDDDLGWTAAKRGTGWRSARPFRMAKSGQLEGTHLSETAWKLPPRPNQLPANQFFLFADILERLVPPIDTMPVGTFWVPGRAGADAIQHLSKVLVACQLWCDTARNIGAVWGALVPAARDETTLDIALRRARGANIRLAYHEDIPKPVTDALLPRATAVYAGYDCPWRNFARTFRRRLPILEVLILRPRTTGMPPRPLRTFDDPLDAPIMRICEVSGPLLLVAPLLERLAMRLCTPSQVMRTLAGLSDVSLVRLVLEDFLKADGLRVDLTSLLRGVRRDRMRFLRIGAGDIRAAGLDIAQERLVFPEVRTLDLAGPMWLSAPKVRTFRLTDVDVDEVLCMLAGISALETLYVRGRLEDDRQQRGTVQALHHIQLPIRLQEAAEITLAGAMSEETVHLLRGITAPQLRRLIVFCEMPHAPEHEALAEARATIAHVFGAVDQPATSENVHFALDEARQRLIRGGQHVVVRALNILPGFPRRRGWVAAASAGQFSWELTSAAATETMRILAEAHERPPALHNGHLLARVVRAALDAYGAPDPQQEDVEIHLQRQDDGIHFRVLVRDGMCALDFVLAESESNEWPTSGWLQYDRTDSRMFGAARMLFGLSVAAPRALRVVDDPFRVGYGLHGADSLLLHEVLRSYERVVDVRLDYAHLTHDGFYFLSALAQTGVLPALERMVVVVNATLDEPLHYLDTPGSSPHQTEPIKARYQMDPMPEKIVRKLLQSLRQRASEGRRLEYLELQGSYCLGEVDAAHATILVDRFERGGTLCPRPGGAEECNVCCWVFDAML